MKKILFTSAMAFLMFACGNNKKDSSGSGISIDGSSTVYPVTEAIAEEYRNEDSEVDVTIGVSGTGGGFQKFGRGDIDIANASRSIKEDEKAIAAENNIKFIELEVAYDGLAVIAHPENDWLDCITVEELKTIWEPAAQGKIKRWNQIRSEWPDEEIHLYGPGVASGTFDYFTEAINGKSGSSRGDYTASEDDNVLVQGVSGDKYGLGFFGLAYYAENSNKLKLVGVDGGEGCVEPTAETVSNGSYAPLSRPLFVYVNSSSIQNNPKVIDFMEFYLEEVPSLLKDVGYVPLTEEEYKRERKKFSNFVEQNKAE
ncbi:MAG: PstS family phosphate ABC transporter substrate-binding protein [Salegentibacter sp.]|uniref:Phosphate-binding protein n=1 Tax=Salegentibacter flavus TaxID=287099 RepID=A0A1I5C9E8_9FLAO|nr:MULTISPECIES: PstS family phosphate ABC transporter substrate-binding protein [Salegentibacter]MDR9457315.1 PstS family phosphate ABC transporter substrate-binding protein [Salegentibacter sp.]SFN83506.1 phosphate ABC transporter substrate-binding protein, PhoT family (TC 3.A.1.7.1) [Salegentibacter flavus]